MPNNDTDQIKKALKKHPEWKKIEKTLENYLKSDLTLEEKGRFYVELTQAFLTMSNDINSNYLQILNATIKKLKESNKKEAEEDNKQKIRKARKAIQKL